MSSFRTLPRYPGMQIHAVPEAERAIDPAGRRLPWAYSQNLPTAQPASPSAGTTSEPIERGPFGRSARRRRGTSRSRSKTAEMMGKKETEEERTGKENLEREDMVFGKLARKAEGPEKSASREALKDVEVNTAGSGVQRPAVSDDLGEPTEVLLWGFGGDMQWAALDFYERASGGVILEDYERNPPGARFTDTARTYGRRQALGSLSKTALRKRNQYAGGDHWIKVTFDSRASADIACARSPHVVHGYVVHAEPWRGAGPHSDEAVVANGGANGLSNSFGSSSRTLGVGGSPQSSETISSATVTGAGNDAGERQPRESQGIPVGLRNLFARSEGTALVAPAERQPEMQQIGRGPLEQGLSSTSQPAGNQQLQRRTLGRIEGARVATLLPADQALMPKQPSPHGGAVGILIWLLTLGWLFSALGADNMIGNTVPKKEDGTFDWDKAGSYWRFWAWLDTVIGTDFCGLRAED